MLLGFISLLYILLLYLTERLTWLYDVNHDSMDTEGRDLGEQERCTAC